MARDIKLEFNTDFFEGDVILGNGDLEREEGLGTAVLMSLFSDRLADDSDNYDNNDKKGWWADALLPDEGDLIGSRLYLLDRAKTLPNTEVKAKEYIYEALEWMIDDGIAEEVEIDTFTFGESWNKRLGAVIKIYRTSGNLEQFKFNDLWSNTPTIGERNVIQ